jgi:hypothetical protein
MTLARNVFAITAMAIAVAGFVAIVWFRGSDQEQTAIRRLPDSDRRALYERTMRTLQSTCVAPERTRGLDDFCRGQAEFILKFSECDAPCVSLAGKFRPNPTR